MVVFDEAGQINQDVLAGTMIVTGIFVTFFGAKYFKQIMFLVGFLIGAFATYYAVPLIWSWFNSEIAPDTLLYISLVGGALCGVLLVVIYKAAVFSVGAICGAILSQIVWITVTSFISLPDEDWVYGVQLGGLIIFALIGGYLALKFVEQLLKGVTAFVGGFMCASSIAYFISRINQDNDRNVVDWVVFFGSYTNYQNIEQVFDHWAIICLCLWIILFAAGCFIQYKFHKRHKRKDGADEYETESDEDDEDIEKPKKKKKAKHEESDDEESEYAAPPSSHGNHVPPPSHNPDYDGHSEYAGSIQYGGSVRQNHKYGASLVNSHSPRGPHSAQSEGGGQAFNFQQYRPPPPGAAFSEQYGTNV